MLCAADALGHPQFILDGASHSLVIVAKWAIKEVRQMILMLRASMGFLPALAISHDGSLNAAHQKPFLKFHPSTDIPLESVCAAIDIGSQEPSQTKASIGKKAPHIFF